mgnify:CR=1 FL=1|jgi:hypothetical protein|tara:strand:+ start:466 stop:735 length:270 start_codon:yes stop_codon:yes gene_type:complete
MKELTTEEKEALKEWWKESIGNCVCCKTGCLYCEQIHQEYEESIALSDLTKVRAIIGDDCHCDKSDPSWVFQCYNCHTTMTSELIKTHE